MKVTKEVLAGTVESSDVMIKLFPYSGIKIEIKSSVYKQYGRHIRTLIEDLLCSHSITDVYVVVNDQGALDYVIKSRLLTALARGCEEFAIKWEVKK